MRKWLVRVVLLMIALVVAAPVPIPAEYDHSFSGRLIVHYLAPHIVRTICHSDHDIAGCALLSGIHAPRGTCIIVVSTLSFDPQETYRHERAHCNGWRHE